ncbi:MAG: helix-hairpin-helix domain-containing protein [Gemmataceae bacterium]|nr:helix-hairpin-helix domain-containing protein [Gemmataceae bacterium]
MTPPPPTPNPGPHAPGSPDPGVPWSAQVALAAGLALLLGLLVFRGYGNGLRTRPTEPLLAAGPVALSTAEAIELEQLPGVGPARAGAVVAARAAAPLDGPDDLRRISGFGPATVDKLRPFVRSDPDPPLEGRRKPAPLAAPGGKLRPGDPPVNVNAAPEDELQRIPGVGPVMAKAIAAGRPFRTVDDLDRVKGVGPKTLEKLRPFVTVE